MHKFARFILLLLIFPVAVSCDNGKKGCPEDQKRCADGECRYCCIDDDCVDKIDDCWDLEAIICNDDHECECFCYQNGENCSKEPRACCQDNQCDVFTNTCVTPCTSDSECLARTEIPFYEDLECKSGVCDFDHCRKDADCAGGKVCYEGDCVTIAGPVELKECVILPTSAVTMPGTSITFAATPYLKTGAVAPGYTFTWSSNDENVATVAGGVAIGGSTTGTATITAVVTGCESISCTASVNNYAPISPFVLVVDEQTGAPVEDATVVVGAEAPATTDARGIATFSTSLPADITVSKREYHYVTLRGVERNEVLVHLTRIHHLDFSKTPTRDIAGGIQGEFDFGLIRCEEPQKTCDVSVGLAGLSIPAKLAHLNLETLFGEILYITIQIPEYEQPPLPVGMVLCLDGQPCMKRDYTPVGVPGKRVAWGLGGKIDLAVMIERLGPFILGDFGVSGYYANAVLLAPFYEHFYTSMVPNVNVHAVDEVLDYGDINNNGFDDCCCPAECASEEYCHPWSCTCEADPHSVGECPDTVPNYSDFPLQDMTLKVSADRSMTFHAPELPVGVYDAVFLLGGVIVRGAGFVPLGLASGWDCRNSNDPPDGVIDEPIVLHVAEVAGRVPEGQVQRMILAMAFNISPGENEEEPGYYAGQILLVDDFSGTHTLNAFMSPTEATYQPGERRLGLTSIPEGSDLSMAIFSARNGAAWNVFGQFATGDFTLPSAPPEGDRAEKVKLFSIQLGEGITYQDLPEFNNTNLENLVESVRSFSFVEVP